MFAYVLSSMLDGEFMFAVLDVAEVFFRIVLPKEHSLDEAAACCKIISPRGLI